MVRLSMEIHPTSFTLEHIPKTLSPTGNITSAPKDFSVYVSVLASGGPLSSGAVPAAWAQRRDRQVWVREEHLPLGRGLRKPRTKCLEAASQGPGLHGFPAPAGGMPSARVIAAVR